MRYRGGRDWSGRQRTIRLRTDAGARTALNPLTLRVPWQRAGARNGAAATAAPAQGQHQRRPLVPCCWWAILLAACRWPASNTCSTATACHRRARRKRAD